MSLSICTVSPGDTLSGIAKAHKVGLAELLRANPQITDPDHIVVGARLNVPAWGGNYEHPAWYRVALRELGVVETSGAADTARIVEYHQATDLRATDDETPWCSAFANWCFLQAGIVGTRSAAARSWLTWGEGISLAEGPPRVGDVVVLRRGDSAWQGHVGFYAGEGDGAGWIRVLGGNQGDAVTVAQYLLTHVLGYRRPARSARA
jgi:uncharacterized protein (TIGR02594 family)